MFIHAVLNNYLLLLILILKKKTTYTHKHKPIHRLKQGNLKYVKPVLPDIIKHFKRMSIKCKKYLLSTNW